MSKFRISTNFLVFITILIVSISAKPTSNENTENDEYTKLLNDGKAAEKTCKEQNKNDTDSSGEEKKLAWPENDFCFFRCMLEKTGHMKNNEIDLDKMIKSFEIIGKAGLTPVSQTAENLEIFKKCITKTNSKNLEGCDVMKDVKQCVDEERSAAKKTEST